MTPDGEDGVGPDGPPAAPAGEVGAAGEVGSEAEVGSEVVHDTTGLDLARALARTARGRPASRRTPERGRSSRGPRRSGGDTRAGSGAHPDERDPQTIDATLGRVVSEHGWAPDLRAHGVFARWPEIVGAEVAAHSRPESFADGRLVVGTDSTAWATQLRLLSPALVRRLNTELGHGSVVAIDVKGPHVPSWTRGARSVRGGRGPRDTYG
ncbi:hypothetical protein GCM10009737_03360 [Nocardioides lentus]|uniref:DUF721 domain-containing protein n=1 Tax=Nocardioides lentus TaxID=338077 RepID=A0ABN2NZC0_9ACTN